MEAKIASFDSTVGCSALYIIFADIWPLMYIIYINMIRTFLTECSLEMKTNNKVMRIIDISKNLRPWSEMRSVWCVCVSVNDMYSRSYVFRHIKYRLICKCTKYLISITNVDHLVCIHMAIGVSLLSCPYLQLNSNCLHPFYIILYLILLFFVFRKFINSNPLLCVNYIHERQLNVE